MLKFSQEPSLPMPVTASSSSSSPLSLLSKPSHKKSGSTSSVTLSSSSSVGSSNYGSSEYLDMSQQIHLLPATHGPILHQPYLDPATTSTGSATSTEHFYLYESVQEQLWKPLQRAWSATWEYIASSATTTSASTAALFGGGGNGRGQQKQQRQMEQMV